MRRIVVYEWMSLDGVVQAPASPEEDSSGGFTHGGWHLRYFEEVSQGWVVDGLSRAEGFLLGRRTYELLAAYWPTAPEEEQALAKPLNTAPKYVVSRTLDEPLAWRNSLLLRGDVPRAVAALKESDGGELQVLGSTELVHTLLDHDLVDELQLMVDPVLLGGGKRLFPENGRSTHLHLVDSRPVSTGAVLCSYVRKR